MGLYFLRFGHGWIPLVLIIVTVGHSVGQICYAFYLLIFIALMEEKCPERQGISASREIPIVSRNLCYISVHK